ncbi:hypothetical protein PAECIP111893_04524 [Paenibacillus plantiphilus]|uniref:Uncharacterized protein n=1 Tax=Paenibacillus plantiphilus TaxID=2905650 RepID=A0ABM9CQ77_9BACL|nr:hypothetical protein [Paenibacillus plantiphilus]CAH1219236.1 hypothetical protein PAECIP111893_04524 [Paenibacillus plantiphilus]
MKRQYSAITWFLAGGLLAVLGYLLYHMPWFQGAPGHFVQEKYRSMNGHAPFMRGGFRGEPIHHSIHWASLLLKVGVLLLGGLIWAKGKGMARWAGGILAIIAMLSLLNPLVCAVIVALVYLLHRRLNKHGQTVLLHEPISKPCLQPEYDRAQLLDEWEKNTTKEEH